ncbi:hypothetical protein CEUSTIGMA_g9590.t1 [Chlamydomonas eustigma]|uniref:Prolyl 4-hydroxylase alpha subunit Fe(2+) 2OG dioxygenase domain-containing protein n=1 Tax=Chlamydomonas eustigma TaxID=1157962 RepID=A0A250XGW7_9CHLO|nr:hypothetical protein CEUSTIGMA_g9590.t1 [Chlamydomonas eustigma]|eukprot:GAX82162.1 hypothetical protein CEUSTIGMA_g9590.t1 [Chlamydomonas eustigma]
MFIVAERYWGNRVDASTQQIVSMSQRMIEKCCLQTYAASHFGRGRVSAHSKSLGFAPWCPSSQYSSWVKISAKTFSKLITTSVMRKHDVSVLIEDEDEEEPPLEQLSLAQHVITVEKFLPEAQILRDVFDKRFDNPRDISPERFMWDYWHVPDQYTLIRTQAQVYFSSALYDRLEDALISYGESVLGCRGITPIWMSYYVDGCVQELHCDNPHGPFAFVLSLTDWDARKFRGGETMILHPGVLDYWGSLYSSQQGLEQQQLVQLVEPKFNRLTVFDPRFPHGVKAVSGTRDPREARLVLHGWFTEPTPFFRGGLSADEAASALDDAMGDIMEILQDLPPATGILTIRLEVNGTTGEITKLEWLADTLIATPGPHGVPSDQVRAGMQQVISETLLGSADSPSNIRFPPSKDGTNTEITLPIVFE